MVKLIKKVILLKELQEFMIIEVFMKDNVLMVNEKDLEDKFLGFAFMKVNGKMIVKKGKELKMMAKAIYMKANGKMD